MKRDNTRCLGNDIVDLSDPDSDDVLQNQRIVSRVLNPEEIDLVEKSCNPRSTYWAIWAAKESAFKATNQLFPKTCFIPKKFIVSKDFSEVRYRTQRLALKVEQSFSYIHALCAINRKELSRIYYCIRPKSYLLRNFSLEVGADPGQSKLVRILLKRECKKLFSSMEKVKYECKDTEEHSLPQVKIINTTGETMIPVSLSHHGEFFATALLLPKGYSFE